MLLSFKSLYLIKVNIQRTVHNILQDWLKFETIMTNFIWLLKLNEKLNVDGNPVKKNI